MLLPEESIREVVKDCMDAWNKHDAKALASLYAEDGEFTSWVGWVKGRVGGTPLRNTTNVFLPLGSR